MSMLHSLASQLGLSIHDEGIVSQAFIHRSYLNESHLTRESNERLEFLGDAVLELITTEYLFKNFLDYQEGMLTNLRASLVKTESLADIALTLKLDKLILMSKGEELSGGRTNKSILADTFEALLGAVYLDQGLTACHTILDKHLFPKLPGILKEGMYKDSKSSLQEYAQAELKSTPKYLLLSETGPDHDKEFIMQVIIGETKYATGTGKSKQEAQEVAARKTLEILGR